MSQMSAPINAIWKAQRHNSLWAPNWHTVGGCWNTSHSNCWTHYWSARQCVVTSPWSIITPPCNKLLMQFEWCVALCMQKINYTSQLYICLTLHYHYNFGLDITHACADLASCSHCWNSYMHALNNCELNTSIHQYSPCPMPACTLLRNNCQRANKIYNKSTEYQQRLFHDNDLMFHFTDVSNTCT
jgi:hypothetical protein